MNKTAETILATLTEEEKETMRTHSLIPVEVEGHNFLMVCVSCATAFRLSDEEVIVYLTIKFEEDVQLRNDSIAWVREAVIQNQ